MNIWVKISIRRATNINLTSKFYFYDLHILKEGGRGLEDNCISLIKYILKDSRKQ